MQQVTVGAGQCPTHNATFPLHLGCQHTAQEPVTHSRMGTEEIGALEVYHIESIGCMRLEETGEQFPHLFGESFLLSPKDLKALPKIILSSLKMGILEHREEM